MPLLTRLESAKSTILYSPRNGPRASPVLGQRHEPFAFAPARTMPVCGRTCLPAWAYPLRMLWDSRFGDSFLPRRASVTKEGIRTVPVEGSGAAQEKSAFIPSGPAFFIAPVVPLTSRAWKGFLEVLWSVAEKRKRSPRRAVFKNGVPRPPRPDDGTCRTGGR